MGRKHSRERKHFFLYFACWLGFSLAGAGCAPLHIPYGENQLFFQARTSFANGDFITAIKENQEILTRFPQTHGDQSLYSMGMIYAYPEYLYANYEISIHYFKRLIREYPESVLKNQAKIWISLLNQSIGNKKEIDKQNKQIALIGKKLKAGKKQIINLQNQIKRLKEIDLGIEEKSSAP